MSQVLRARGSGVRFFEIGGKEARFVDQTRCPPIPKNRTPDPGLRRSLARVSWCWMSDSRLRMCLEEFPDDLRAVDIAAHLANDPFGEVLHTVRPSVTASLDSEQHHFRAVLALRIRELLHAATVIGGAVGQVFLDRLALAAVVLDPLLDRFV